MAIQVSFEIGHTAKLKSKKTPEGFTHDWELYVRGVDKGDISHFVDKVVFNLHDSFHKPKRTYKEAPYVLKESGYAGFILSIDIYFKNRDDPKRVTYSYDLDLQTTGPPVHRSVKKKFVFNSASEDFKQKLLKGGGSLLMANFDEKSRDSIEDRPQSKVKAINESTKKHKIRPEDSKMQTFATLFGTPITKTSTKVSPDPKSKGSPNISSSIKNNNKVSDKSSSTISGSVKEKSDKTDKKDKHRRSSPHRERDAIKDDRKAIAEEKRDRKEEKSKEKSHSKDRDRSKDRATKRPPSPKKLPSPKRVSPPRSSSATSRGEENVSKQQVKGETDAKKVSGNSGKKSKKEKKSHEKDKDREKKERDRDRKEKDERSNSSNPTLSSTPSNITHSNNAPAKSIPDVKNEIPKKESGQVKDAKETKKMETKVAENTNSEKKTSEKHDKDTEKKHKHKKKDKNKDKDATAKEKKKEKSTKQKDDIKKASQLSPAVSEQILTAQQKSTPNATNNASSKISDQESSESENESPISQNNEPKTNNNHSDASNSSFPDVIVQKPVIPHFEEPKLEKKEHKTREKAKPDKETKKRKRKSKDDPEPFIRKSVSPVVVNNQPEQPPNKQSKKEADEKANSPNPSAITSSQAALQEASSRVTSSSPVFRTPSSAPIAAPPSTNNTVDRNSINMDYMSELRELQHKIMTLQDNNELQQVVEMIAATGRFEVTSKTFDFDLCALDRTTVQRLQDFLATTVS